VSAYILYKYFAQTRTTKSTTSKCDITTPQEQRTEEEEEEGGHASRSGLPHDRGQGRRRAQHVYEPAPFVRKVESYVQASAGSVLSGTRREALLSNGNKG
jgi:hypothetical protein